MATQLVETRPMGRPLVYDEEDKERVFAHVVAEVAAGRSVAKIFREDREAYGLCSVAVFWGWHFADANFQDQLARAREHGVEAIIEEARDIADQDELDYEIIEDEKGRKRLKVNGEAIQRSKLRADMRIKTAQMLAPRKYGVKLDVTSGGEKLPVNQQHFDQRLQSIVMQAAHRAALSKELEGWDALTPEAKALLE